MTQSRSTGSTRRAPARPNGWSWMGRRRRARASDSATITIGISRAGLYHPRAMDRDAFSPPRRVARRAPRSSPSIPSASRARGRARRADPPRRAGRRGPLVGYEPGPRAAPARPVRSPRPSHRGLSLARRRHASPGPSACTGDGDWLGIEPAADDHPAWGRSDRVWLLDAAGAVGAARSADALPGRSTTRGPTSSRRSSSRVGCRRARAPPCST